jgi:hypothetical protein
MIKRILAVTVVVSLLAGGGVLGPTRIYAQSTQSNFKVAFIGDSGASKNFQSVLDLIKSEGTDMVLHQGDFDYSAGPSVWMNKVDTTLGSSFPYFGSDGNHDNWDSDGYARFFTDRIRSLGISVTPDPGSGTISPSYSITYKGLKMVFSKENGDPTFIDNQLKSDSHTWKVCSWHKNQQYMQVGGKGNAQGWPDYETPGKTFAFVSGIGGNGIRNQDRCLPTTYPYGGGTGCNYIWANIYTSDQGAKYGALFITFNVNGNPNKASAYFKNIDGQIVDQFDITASSAPTTPGPTATPTKTPTGTNPPGDADNDGNVDIDDYVIWINNYNKSNQGSQYGDFNNSGKVDGLDYIIWLENFGS